MATIGGNGMIGTRQTRAPGWWQASDGN